MSKLHLSWWKPRPEGLSQDEQFRRAEHAKRLLADDTLNQALDAMAEDAFAEVLRLDATEQSDRVRAVAIERVRLIKEFRGQLSTFVLKGTPAKRG